MHHHAWPIPPFFNALLSFLDFQILKEHLELGGIFFVFVFFFF
jgi:hypothetical protein